MGASRERSSAAPPSRGLITAGIFLLATLQEIAGQDSCLMGAIKVCRVLRVPELELQIIPQGVVELKGFEGTCSIECINYLQNSGACKREPAKQRDIAATCRALTCWSNVASACGTEISNQSCSKKCALALNATVCRGTEKVFPEYSDYLANFGPASKQCVTLQCTRDYLRGKCRRFDSKSLSMPSSSLCDPRCYRSLFRETCVDAAISIIGLNGMPLPWEEQAFEDTRFGPLSSLCANYTYIHFSVVLEDYSMEDISRDGQPERFAEDIEDSLGSVLLLLGVTSAPDLKVSNLRQASVLDPSDGIAADVAAVFTNDPGGAELFELVLQANPGLLFGEYGDLNVPKRSVNVEEAVGGDVAKGFEMPRLTGPPQPTCRGDPYASFAKWQLQQVEGKWPKAACKQVCDQDEDCLASVFNLAMFQTCKLFSSCDVAAGPGGDLLVFKDGTVPELPVAGPNDPQPVCGGEPFKYYTGWQLKQTGQWVKSACIDKCARNSKCVASVFNDLAFKKCKLYESCVQVTGSPDDILVFKQVPGVPPPPLAIFIPPPLPPASPTQPMPVCGGTPYAYYPTWKLEKYPDWPKMTCQKLCQDDGKCVASVHNAEIFRRCKLFDTCTQAPGRPDDELVFKSIPGVAPPPLLFFTAAPTPAPGGGLTPAPAPGPTSSALTPAPTPRPTPTITLAPTSSALTPAPTPTTTPETSSPAVAPTPLVTLATTPAPTLVPSSPPTAALTLSPTPTPTPKPTSPAPTSTIPATPSPITTPTPPTLPLVTETPTATAESETPSQTPPEDDPDATPVSQSPDESSTKVPDTTPLVPSAEDSSSRPASNPGEDADSNTGQGDRGAGSPVQSPDASVVVVGGSERSPGQAADGRTDGDIATEEDTEPGTVRQVAERGLPLQAQQDPVDSEGKWKPVAIGVGVAAGSATVVGAAALIAAKAKAAAGAAAATGGGGGGAAAAPAPAGLAVDPLEPELPTRLETDMDAMDGGGISLASV